MPALDPRPHAHMCMASLVMDLDVPNVACQISTPCKTNVSLCLQLISELFSSTVTGFAIHNCRGFKTMELIEGAMLCACCLVSSGGSAPWS